ncbi:MAG: hypothetical protein E3J37_07235 [Anaerolineales bacterium]|nr:MAG: hypothetical protein E3J37_07235 [Anaerolineales bacterium]
MDVVVSVWRPWRTATWPHFISIEDQVKAAIAVQADAIAIKGTNKTWVYGAKENLPWPYKAHSNDAMEQEAKAQSLAVDLWCWVDCKNPATQATRVKEATARWNPRNVKLDVEGGVAKKYAYNTGAFLRSLGRLYRHDGTPVKVWLQSYRRPDLHPIAWHKWLTYTDQAGIYLLEGVAPQAYYAGTDDSLSDYARMLRAYDKLSLEIHRTFDWHVTLPTYREHDWQPTAESLEVGIGFLRNELSDRLKGVDFFRLGWLMDKQLEDVRVMLAGYDWGNGEEPEPQIPFEELPEVKRWGIVGGDLRRRGVV